MNLCLIPQPSKITTRKGVFSAGTTDEYKIIITQNRKIPPQAYKLDINTDCITIETGSESGEFYARQTLTQLASQFPDGRIPLMTIEDRPDFPQRGIYYDVARGRVPKLESLMEMAERLAHYKINQLQLYFEHTFKFPSHPDISRGASPLTAKDILLLDEFCIQRHIELVPSIASFGHMSRILTKPKYQHFAEDICTGRYASPDAENMPAWFKGRKGWSLAPANPETYKFIGELFSDLLPLFSSKRVNVCCDEVFDMGLGQSVKLAGKTGKAGLFLFHVKNLRKIAAQYGKKIMIWGDMPRHYPELIRSLPKDITVLDWGYASNYDFDGIKKFTRAGLKCLACPGTSSWSALFPRIHEAALNIHRFASSAKKYGADGLLTTDWGDGGHYNFMEYSWHGYLMGAEQGWNSNADLKSFTKRFIQQFLEIKSAELENAIVALGDITHLSVEPFYQSIWKHIFFAKPDSEIFTPARRPASLCHNGTVSSGRVVLSPALGATTLRRLGKIRKILYRHTEDTRPDIRRILLYWLFAVDTLSCAALKLTLYGSGRKPSAVERKLLKKELHRLQGRFKDLWLMSNRPSEIHITLQMYRKMITSLK